MLEKMESLISNSCLEDSPLLMSPPLSPSSSVSSDDVEFPSVLEWVADYDDPDEVNNDKHLLSFDHFKQVLDERRKHEEMVDKIKKSTREDFSNDEHHDDELEAYDDEDDDEDFVQLYVLDVFKLENMGSKFTHDELVSQLSEILRTSLRSPPPRNFVLNNTAFFLKSLCLNPACVTNMDSMVNYLLRTLVICPSIAVVDAAKDAILTLLDSCQKDFSLGIVYEDICDIFLNFGADPNEYCPVDMQGEQSLLCESDEIHVDWKHNFSSFLCVFPKIVPFAGFSDTELQDIILLLLWMSMDRNVMTSPCLGIIQNCVAHLLQNIQEEEFLLQELPQCLSKYANSLHYDDPNSPKLIEYFLLAIPITLKQGLLLQVSTCYKCLCSLLETDEMEYSFEESPARFLREIEKLPDICILNNMLPLLVPLLERLYAVIKNPSDVLNIPKISTQFQGEFLETLAFLVDLCIGYFPESNVHVWKEVYRLVQNCHSRANIEHSGVKERLSRISARMVVVNMKSQDLLFDGFRKETDQPCLDVENNSDASDPRMTENATNNPPTDGEELELDILVTSDPICLQSGDKQSLTSLSSSTTERESIESHAALEFGQHCSQPSDRVNCCMLSSMGIIEKKIDSDFPIADCVNPKPCDIIDDVSVHSSQSSPRPTDNVGYSIGRTYPTPGIIVSNVDGDMMVDSGQNDPQPSSSHTSSTHRVNCARKCRNVIEKKADGDQNSQPANNGCCLSKRKCVVRKAIVEEMLVDSDQGCPQPTDSVHRCQESPDNIKKQDDIYQSSSHYKDNYCEEPSIVIMDIGAEVVVEPSHSSQMIVISSARSLDTTIEIDDDDWDEMYPLPLEVDPLRSFNSVENMESDAFMDTNTHNVSTDVVFIEEITAPISEVLTSSGESILVEKEVAGHCALRSCSPEIVCLGSPYSY